MDAKALEREREREREREAFAAEFGAFAPASLSEAELQHNAERAKHLPAPPGPRASPDLAARRRSESPGASSVAQTGHSRSAAGVAAGSAGHVGAPLSRLAALLTNSLTTKRHPALGVSSAEVAGLPWRRVVNICRSCGVDFSSVSAFDRHRVGRHVYTLSEGLRLNTTHEDGTALPRCRRESAPGRRMELDRAWSLVRHPGRRAGQIAPYSCGEHLRGPRWTDGRDRGGSTLDRPFFAPVPLQIDQAFTRTATSEPGPYLLGCHLAAESSAPSTPTTASSPSTSRPTAELCDVKPQTVRRWLHALEQAGWIASEVAERQAWPLENQADGSRQRP